MTRKNEVKLNMEQLDDRIVPTTFHGSTGSGLTWAYNDVTNKLIINTTAGNDSVTLWNFGTTVGIIDGNSAPYFYNTAAKIGANLKIQVNGSDGNDFIQNALGYGQYGSATIFAGSGNDVLWAGAGKDTLVGGTGNDCFIDGGVLSNTTMVAGTGNDVFVQSQYHFLGGDTFVDYDPSADVTYTAVSGIQASSGADPIVWVDGVVVFQG
jgi:Ca2+-binding RTX toxin-like protein